ncbi:hypothetical protein [Leucobacter sp. G161]|uniref:hypothetical protein n=1 Tax=Leucobacter sp. G161 TaxID=663704 RepID=UPI00073B4BDA|nr:hypothetical protein [Leucobacter sp. G161]KUF07856.1 hypothetical protein AUL38_00865 [Leucobacter sp. G161]
MSRNSLSLLKLAACSAALVLALAGCSASPEAEGEAGGGGGTDAHAAEFQEWELKMAQCFRDKGLDVEDPTPEGGWPEVTQEMQEVSPECQSEVGEPPIKELSEAEKREADKARFEYDSKFGECMRDLGYDIEDAKLGGTSPKTPDGASNTDLDTCSEKAMQ